MNSKEMLENLKTQSENLRKDLIDLEQLFAMKKEQFLDPKTDFVEFVLK